MNQFSRVITDDNLATEKQLQLEQAGLTVNIVPRP